jgi:ferric hydroxamate transport system substrate-binding protein
MNNNSITSVPATATTPSNQNATTITTTTTTTNANQTSTTNFPTDESRIIKHAMGETEVTGIPKGVIALEWIYAENLLALGIQPVGVAEIEDMKEWVNLTGVALDESVVVEVGVRAEPNFETIAQLEPDLIIGHITNNGPIYEDLSRIAPTLLFDPGVSKEDSSTQLEEMRQTFMTMADLLGRHDQGMEVLERMNNTIADAARQVSESGKTGDKFVLALGYTWTDDIIMRIYTNNSIGVEVMEQMGMENAWSVERAPWGFTDATLEDFATAQDADFFYMAPANDNIFEAYADNPAWSNLQFVREGRVYYLGGNSPTGGPILTEMFAEQVAETIAAKEVM